MPESALTDSRLQEVMLHQPFRPTAIIGRRRRRQRFHERVRLRPIPILAFRYRSFARPLILQFGVWLFVCGFLQSQSPESWEVQHRVLLQDTGDADVRGDPPQVGCQLTAELASEDNDPAEPRTSCHSIAGQSSAASYDRRPHMLLWELAPELPLSPLALPSDTLHPSRTPR